MTLTVFVTEIVIAVVCIFYKTVKALIGLRINLHKYRVFPFTCNKILNKKSLILHY